MSGNFERPSQGSDNPRVAAAQMAHAIVNAAKRSNSEIFPTEFDEQLFFSSKNPYLQHVTDNIHSVIPLGHTANDITDVEIAADGSINLNFNNGETQMWSRLVAVLAED